MNKIEIDESGMRITDENEPNNVLVLRSGEYFIEDKHGNIVKRVANK